MVLNRYLTRGLSVAFIVGVLFFVFYGHGTICPGDASFPYDRESAYYNIITSLSPWYDLEFLGRSNLTYLGLGTLFYYFPIWVLYCLLPSASVQFAWAAAISILSFFSINRLISLFGDSKSWQGALLSLVYVFNPWMVDRLINHAHIFQCVAFIPLLLYFFCMWQRTGRLKFVLLFWLASLFILPSKHYVFFAALLVLLMVAYDLCVEREVGCWGYVKFLVTVSLLYSFYWIPLVSALSEQVDILSHFQGAQFFYGRRQTLINSLFFDGFHASIYGNFQVLETAKAFLVVLLGAMMLFVVGKVKKVGLGDKCFFWGAAGVLLLFAPLYPHIIDRQLCGILQKLSGIGIVFSLPDPNYNLYLFIVAFVLALSTSCSLKGGRWVNVALALWGGFVVLYTLVPLAGGADGMLRKMRYPDDYQAMIETLRQDEGSFNVYVFPGENTIKRSWAPYPYINMYDFFSQQHGFLGVETLEANSASFGKWNEYVLDAVDRLDVERFDMLMRIAGVRYLVGHKDVDGRAGYLSFLRKVSLGQGYPMHGSDNLVFVNMREGNGIFFMSDVRCDNLADCLSAHDDVGFVGLDGKRIVGGVYAVSVDDLRERLKGGSAFTVAQNYTDRFRVYLIPDFTPYAILKALLFGKAENMEHFANYGMVNSWMIEEGKLGDGYLLVAFDDSSLYLYGMIVTLVSLCGLGGGLAVSRGRLGWVVES